MEAVAAVGNPAIALDMRGYGESSAPSHSALYTPLYTVGDLVGLLDALDLRTVTVVGHDFAGQRRMECGDDAAGSLFSRVLLERSVSMA